MTDAPAPTISFEVRNRWSGDVQFTAQIECSEETPLRVKIGLAVRWALKAGADLSGADLSRADLSGAYLSRADLSRAYLSRADLSRADLSGAYLSRADLSRADLSGADLSGADLSRADLSRAYLSGAYLSRADLSGADLSGADLSDEFIASAGFQATRILPDGDLIGWKACAARVLVKLRIPADAKRSHAFGRKCRAEFVDVLEVVGAEEGRSQHDGGKTVYRAGERVTSDTFDPDWRNECAPGIHFFITRAEAEAWLL